MGEKCQQQLNSCQCHTHTLTREYTHIHTHARTLNFSYSFLVVYNITLSPTQTSIHTESVQFQECHTSQITSLTTTEITLVFWFTDHITHKKCTTNKQTHTHHMLIQGNIIDGVMQNL